MMVNKQCIGAAALAALLSGCGGDLAQGKHDYVEGSGISDASIRRIDLCINGVEYTINGTNCEKLPYLQRYNIDYAFDDDESTAFIPQYFWDETHYLVDNDMLDQYGRDKEFKGRFVMSTSSPEGRMGFNTQLYFRLGGEDYKTKTVTRIVIKGDIIESIPASGVILRPDRPNRREDEPDYRIEKRKTLTWAGIKQYPLTLILFPSSMVQPRHEVYFLKDSKKPFSYNNGLTVGCKELTYIPGEQVDCTLETPVLANYMKVIIKKSPANLGKGISNIEVYGL